MKVKMLTSRVSPTEVQNVGDVIDVSEAEGLRMIKAGHAEPVRSAKEPEKAVRKGKKAE